MSSAFGAAFGGFFPRRFKLFTKIPLLIESNWPTILLGLTCVTCQDKPDGCTLHCAYSLQEDPRFLQGKLFNVPGNTKCTVISLCVGMRE